jgi:uncharacterized protein (TIGR02147 family)
MNMAEELSPFSYLDYRKYLENRLPVSGKERGIRSRLAEALSCQTAFISRVLHGEAHFSLEHGVVINRFLKHTDAEGEFFLLLVQLARAGSEELRKFFEKQIAGILEKRQHIAERIQVKNDLSHEDQMRYYSTWYYAAIHVLITVPEFQTIEALTNYLRLPRSQIEAALEFLTSTGLVTRDGNSFRAGTTRIHIGKNSPMISKHHTNWRMRAIDAIDRFSRDDLFYSGPVSISHADAEKIHAKYLKFIEEIEAIVKPSKEEGVYCLGLDFYKL